MEERIAELERRIKILNKNKEQIVGKIAVEEQNRLRAIRDLKNYGYDVTSMSTGEIKDLQDKLKAESADVLTELEQNLEKAEALVTKFKEM